MAFTVRMPPKLLNSVEVRARALGIDRDDFIRGVLAIASEEPHTQGVNVPNEAGISQGDQHAIAELFQLIPTGGRPSTVPVPPLPRL